MLALPLFIFVKQFCKTKADYLESIQGYLGRFASHNSIEQSRHTAAMQQQTKRGKKTKDTAMIYTALQPDLLRNPTYASTLTKNIIKSVITNNHEAIKAHVDTALAHCRFQAKHNVPTFAVERPQQKEQTLLYLHKTIVL